MNLPTFRWNLLAAIAVAILVATVSSAGAATTVTSPFSPGAGSAPTVDPFAVNETATFKLSKVDNKALRAHLRANRLRTTAEAERARNAAYDERIDYIQNLIDEASGDEQRLQDEITKRLVDVYEQGGNADMTFLLDSRSFTDLAKRMDVIQGSHDSEQHLMDQHQLTLDRLAQLQHALQDLRDARNEQAASLEDSASALDVQLAAAQTTHLEESTEAPADTKAAQGGMWLSINADIAPSFFTQFATPGTMPYNGGTSTVKRHATPLEIQQILNDPRIDIYAGGRGDIQAGRIDGRVIDAIMALANRFGTVHITSLMSGHGVYTSSGNISEHSMGCAADIGALNGVVITPSTQGPGSITELGVKFLASLTGDLAPHQVISLNAYGGPTLAMADHYDHIHLGYHC